VDRLLVAKEFSYSTSRHAGDGWVLVGDAFGFIDPIYSTGALLAFKSAEMAADAIVEGLRSGDTSARQLGKWTPDFEIGLERFRTLVRAFYTPEFSFAEFVRRFPQHKSSLTDLLIGRAFTPDADRLFTDLVPALAGAA
jgi:flavin-dependent dehydrogenase